MDDGPQRVEIELTEAAPSRSRLGRRRGGGAGPATAQPVTPTVPSAAPADWSPPDGAVVVTSDALPAPGDAGSDGRRVAAIAAAVGIVALVAGWALGRSGGDGSAQSVDATTTVEASTSDDTPDSTLIPGESIAPAQVPTTTRPRPSTTTTTTMPAEWTTEQVEIDPRLAGVTDTIVGIGSPWDLVELDLATGELRSLELTGIVAANVYSVAAGPDWTMFTDGSTGNSWILNGDATAPERTSLSLDNGALWQPGTDLFWQVEQSAGRSQTLAEVEVGGSPTGRTIDTGYFWPSMVDVDGSVIVGDGSLGAFVVSPDGSFRLPGSVLAIGEPGWLVRLCGDTIDSCGIAMVDRATREVTPIQVESGGRQVESAIWYGGQSSRPTLSPDGRRALVYLIGDDGATTGAVLDLTTGEAVEQPERGVSAFNMSWSSDGRFVYVLDGTGVSAWDVDAGEVFSIAPGLGSMNTISIRPAAAAAG